MEEQTLQMLGTSAKKGLKARPVISTWIDDRAPLDKGKFPEYAGGKDDIFPVKLRATFQVMKDGEKKFAQDSYPLYYDNGRKVVATLADFNEAKFSKATPRVKLQQDIRKELIKAEAKADTVCLTTDFVTRENFEFLYSTAGNMQAVKSVFDLVIGKAKTVGTKKAYKNARDKVFNYAPDLTFAEINVEWIEKMLATIRHGKTGGKLSETTKNMYLRAFKRVFNVAIDLKLVKAEAYPFGKERIVIKETEARHIQLTHQEKDKLEAAVFFDKAGTRFPSAAKKTEARDMWLFSFYCSGLNMADIFDLKRGDIAEDEIRKYRQKTVHSTNKKLKIPIDLPEVQHIIAKYGVLNSDPEAYVFPIYSAGCSEEERARLKHNKLTQLNKWLKKIQKELGIRKTLTTYTARHSFACILYEAGVPTEELQGMLGHAKKDMTEHYVDGFPSAVKKARQQLLRKQG